MAAQILRRGNERPNVDDEAFIAAGAMVAGGVAAAEGASIWFKCALRGDVGRITIGARSHAGGGCDAHGEQEDTGRPAMGQAARQVRA